MAMQSPSLPRIKVELLAGLIAGTVFLGIGGRVVMRVIALATDRPPAGSPSGTFTVLLLGMGVGLFGAAVHLVLMKLIPIREVLREAVFGAILSLLTARGLNNQMSLPASLFFVLVGLYGVSVIMAGKRLSEGKPARSSGSSL